MAKSEDNEVMFGARGQVGNLVVFKKYYGRTIISKVRTKRDKPSYSLKQELAKERFKEGVIYAKGVVQDQILSDFYRPLAKNGVSIYNLALADFCKAPEIKSINADYYQGNIGDKLTIRAVDNFRVVDLLVTIAKPDGIVIESGNAQQAPNGVDWIYISNAANENTEERIIKVKATDTPGNVSQLEQTITV